MLALTFLIVSTAVAQGQFLQVQFQPKKSISAKADLNFLGKSLPCYRENELVLCLAAVPANAPAGWNDLAVAIQGKPVYKSKIEIVSTPFPTEDLPLTNEKKSLLKRADRPKELKKIRAALATETPLRLAGGDFIRPVDGAVESEYGEKRTVDGKLRENYYHRGLDLKASMGAPIHASNSGLVTLAGFFIEEGNMVMVNHGQGITTAYLHMSKILVKPGQKVKKGEILGKVGDTGVANSPHLHWGVYIHGTPIDPLFWLKKSPQIFH